LNQTKDIGLCGLWKDNYQSLCKCNLSQTGSLPQILMSSLPYQMYIWHQS